MDSSHTRKFSFGTGPTQPAVCSVWDLPGILLSKKDVIRLQSTANKLFFSKVPAWISDIFGSCTGQCWWCLVQLPWKGVWWRQPQPVIWCDKLNNTKLVQFCSSGWKDSWAQKTPLYQIYELLPGTWLALGPSYPCARRASSNSRFGSVAVPTSGDLAGEALPATSHTLSQLSSTKSCWQEISGQTGAKTC